MAYSSVTLLLDLADWYTFLVRMPKNFVYESWSSELKCGEHCGCADVATICVALRQGLYNKVRYAANSGIQIKTKTTHTHTTWQIKS